MEKNDDTESIGSMSSDDEIFTSLNNLRLEKIEALITDLDKKICHISVEVDRISHIYGNNDYDYYDENYRTANTLGKTCTVILFLGIAYSAYKYMRR